MTMVDTLYDDHYKSREKLAWEFATILNQEAKELEAAGVDIIQFDEPAFNVFLDEVKDWGVAALERAAEGLRAETAVHICYGYGIKANTDWKATLGSQWRQYEESFPLLQSSSIDIISLECQNSHVPMDLIELLRGKPLHGGQRTGGDGLRHGVVTACPPNVSSCSDGRHFGCRLGRPAARRARPGNDNDHEMRRAYIRRSRFVVV